jgi:hypothetical protein
VIGLQDLLPGLLLNLVAAFVLIGFIYYPARRSKAEFVFAYFTFFVIIYFITGLLRDVQLTLGMGFGLMAIFGVLRFQAERLPLREMVFLFVSISLPFVNQLFVATRITFSELIILNIFILALIYVLDRGWGVRYEEERQILYEKIDLIRPENYDALLADLRDRTGLPIKHVMVNEINFMRDVAQITIYYETQR